MSDWLTSNSGGSGNPGVAFDQIGAKVVGKIAAEPRPVETQYGERLVVELVAADGCTATAGEDRAPIAEGDEVALWIKPGAMARAVREAIQRAGATGLEEEATLAVVHSAEGERKPGRNPAKLYAAEYQAPVSAVAVGESLI